MFPDLDDIQAIVTTVADRVLSKYREGAAFREKQDGTFVTEADEAMQAAIARELHERWPHTALLGEEMPPERQQSLLTEQEWLWCLDPLDGTSNFAAGIPFFSVSLALLHHGSPVLGVVYDPVRRECFAAQKGAGSWCNGERLLTAPSRTLDKSMGLVDFKRLEPQLAGRLVESPPYYSHRNFGSCALEWCWLAAGRVHVYLHGGMRLWDYAAGSLILEEAGGQACTLEGTRVLTDTLVSRSIVAASSPELLEQWKRWLGLV